MKTLIILDKTGTIGMQYALVEGDLSKYNGLVLNDNSNLANECVKYLTEGVASNTITLIDDISLYNGIMYKTALILYYF